MSKSPRPGGEYKYRDLNDGQSRKARNLQGRDDQNPQAGCRQGATKGLLSVDGGSNVSLTPT